MDPNKVRCVLQWPIPWNLKEVLGLTRYYRRFIKDYGKIVHPLTILLKKERAAEFRWNHNAQVAFRKLQLAMTSTPMLATPDFTQAFIIECDASNMGVGAVLMLLGRPLALAERWWGKSTYEKEALAMAIQHWRPY